MASMVCLHDLKVADDTLEQGKLGNEGLNLVLLRHVLIEISNAAEIADHVGALHKENSELGTLYKSLLPGFGFIMYLRNKYVGHYVTSLARKTVEWRPVFYIHLVNNGPELLLSASMYSLETVINTYVNQEGKHRYFDSTTDLTDPDHVTRFFHAVGEIATGTIDYLTQLIEVSRIRLDTPDMSQELLELYYKADETEFSYIKKSTR
jgi:hypothetical protein